MGSGLAGSRIEKLSLDAREAVQIMAENDPNVGSLGILRGFKAIMH